MSDRLPEFIEPLRLAEQRRALKGRLRLSQMRRLVPLLADGDGEVVVAIEFGIDELGVRFARGHFGTTLRLTCQRCLEPVTLPVNGSVSLGVVRSEREGERLPGQYEPLIVGAEAVLLPALVEDEIMLALPIVPTHAPGQCPVCFTAAGEGSSGTPEEAEATAKVSPFAVLGTLKNKREN